MRATRSTANRGRVALRYGPLVYNIERVDQDITGALDPSSPLKAEWRPDLLGGVTVITGKFARRRADAGDPELRALQPQSAGAAVRAAAAARARAGRRSAGAATRTAAAGIDRVDKRVVALVALLSAGCGGSSPGSPSDPLAFQAGRYRLSIIGLQCGSKEFETALPSVVLAVTVRPDGAAWVALPEHANGTLTLRFEKGTAIPNLQAVVVTGTVSGSADDEGSADTPAADATHVRDRSRHTLRDDAVPGIRCRHDRGPGSFHARRRQCRVHSWRGVVDDQPGRPGQPIKG